MVRNQRISPSNKRREIGHQSQNRQVLSASLSHQPYSPAPTRSSNEAARVHRWARQFGSVAGGGVGQQSDRIRRIGVLMAFKEDDARAKGWLARFTGELAELGWTSGPKLRIEVRWAADSVDQMRAYAKELVSQQPDLILSFGTPVTAALQHETRTIPIVFAIVSDPVGEGFVATLAHPGGNITGFHNSEDAIGGKWLELLSQIAPEREQGRNDFQPGDFPTARELLHARLRGCCVVAQNRTHRSTPCTACRNSKRRSPKLDKSLEAALSLWLTSFCS